MENVMNFMTRKIYSLWGKLYVPLPGDAGLPQINLNWYIILTLYVFWQNHIFYHVSAIFPANIFQTSKVPT